MECPKCDQIVAVWDDACPSCGAGMVRQNPPRGQAPLPPPTGRPGIPTGWEPTPPVSGGPQPLPPPAPAASARVPLVVAALVLAIAVGLAGWTVLRVGSSTAPTVAAGTPSATAGAPGAQATPSPLPSGTLACGTQGAGDTAAVYAAAKDTSCAFALNVATAYRQAAPEGGPATVTATSPVTKQSYDLTCSGSLPTICRATTGATVYLTRAS